MLVRDGVLREVGPTRRVENLSEARHAIEINAAGRVVMPGFVDSHTHLLFPPPGAPRCDLPGARRLLAGTTAVQLKLRAARYLQAMARHGTTTVEVKTGSGTESNTEMKILRVLAELKADGFDVVPTFLFFPPRLQDDPGDGYRPDWSRVRDELLPKIAQRRWSAFADLVWDDFTGMLWKGSADRAAWFEGYFQVAASLGFPLKLHADGGSLSGAASAALRCHAASIDHLEHASESDLAVLSRGEAVATLLPGASFHSGAPYAPGRALIDAGVAVALATNFNAQDTPTLSMQTVVSLALHEMDFTTAEAIAAATINGAYALERGGTVGSIECGKFADLLLLNVSDYREISCCLGTNLVYLAMKRGEVVYQEAEVAPRPPEDLGPAW